MGGIFGVRRPLRFLAHKLDLSDEQIAELAQIIDDLKTERAQSKVDGRRAKKLFVEAFGGDSFASEKAVDAAKQRVASYQRVQDAVVDALEKIHGVLTPEQRSRLGTLIRAGALNF